HVVDLQGACAPSQPPSHLQERTKLRAMADDKDSLLVGQFLDAANLKSGPLEEGRLPFHRTNHPRPHAPVEDAPVAADAGGEDVQGDQLVREPLRIEMTDDVRAVPESEGDTQVLEERLDVLNNLLLVQRLLLVKGLHHLPATLPSVFRNSFRGGA